MIGHSIFIITVALSICCTAYDTFARRYGWPVGEMFAKDASLIKIVSLFAGIWAVGKSFFVFYWWSPLVVLTAGFLLAYFMTLVFKKTAQIICVVGIFPVFIATILYISETKPFGMLHRFFG